MLERGETRSSQAQLHRLQTLQRERKRETLLYRLIPPFSSPEQQPLDIFSRFRHGGASQTSRAHMPRSPDTSSDQARGSSRGGRRPAKERPSRENVQFSRQSLAGPVHPPRLLWVMVGGYG